MSVGQEEASSASLTPDALQVDGRIVFADCNEVVVTMEVSGPAEALVQYNNPATQCVPKLLRQNSNVMGSFSCGRESSQLCISFPIDIFPFFHELGSNPHPVNVTKKKISSSLNARQRGDPGSGNGSVVAAEASSLVEAPIAFDPPCSVWGLPALLLIHGGSSVGEVLGAPDSDASLASHTLMMADFLNAQPLRKKVMAWLKLALDDVAAHCYKDADALITADGDCIFNTQKVWRYLQVLQHVPTRHMGELFEKDGQIMPIHKAAALPASLLYQWLRHSSQTTQKQVRLEGKLLTLAQWEGVLHCCALLPGVETLCIHGSGKHLRQDTRNPALDAGFPFRALERTLVSFKQLACLVISNVPLLSTEVFQLGQVFASAPTSLKTLVLNFTLLPSCKLSPGDKSRLFLAVAQIRGLQELVFPSWRDFVGPDTSAVAPLQQLDQLWHVHVRGAGQVDAHSAAGYGIKFVELDIDDLSRRCGHILGYDDVELCHTPQTAGNANTAPGVPDRHDDCVQDPRMATGRKKPTPGSALRVDRALKKPTPAKAVPAVTGRRLFMSAMSAYAARLRTDADATGTLN